MFNLFNDSLGKSQKAQILKMLQTGKEYSPRDFMMKWFARYWASIFTLRKEWHDIKMREEIKRDAKNYSIVERHTFYSLTH